MKPFFVYSHLGINQNYWLDFFTSHKRIISGFYANDQNVYENANLEKMAPKNTKWYFSNAKWFDILYHNYQIGFKNFYKNYPAILIYSFNENILSNIRKGGLIDIKFCKNYYDYRMMRLNYICKKAIKPLVFVEGLSRLHDMKLSLCDHLGINEEFDFEIDLPAAHIDNEFFKNLKKMNDEGLIKLVC
jgi:hypothetical protein